MTPRLLAVIPARGGSKGIPSKNLQMLGDLPLISHAIRAAQGARTVSHIVVSTDSSEIAAAASAAGVPTSRLRPAALAQDGSATADVVRYELAECVRETGDVFEHLLVLQPTSPLRRAHHVDEAVNHYYESGAPSLVSVCEAGSAHPDYMYTASGDRLAKLLDGAAGTPRQQLGTVYVRNGAIYVTSVEYFERTGTLVSPNPAYYVMNRRSSINIDVPEDLALARALLTLGD